MGDYSIQFREADRSRKQTVRIETVGDMFILYSNEWRSGAYSFEDLVATEDKGATRIFNIFQGEHLRKGWEMSITGDIPNSLATYLPKPKVPMISRSGMLAIAFLCIAIVYSADKLI